jgi:hypothetical protein
MALDAKACAVRRCRRSVDRLDVCTERIALVLGPDSVLAIARYVRKPAAAWTGDHAAISTDRDGTRVGFPAASRATAVAIDATWSF